MWEHILPFQTILAYWHKGKFLVLTARALKSSRSKLYIYKCNLPSVMLPAVTFILPTLLYACKIWTVYRRHTCNFNHFHLTCLCKILKVKWPRIPDMEVLAAANIPTIHTMLRKHQVRWAGHVTRMSDKCIPKQPFFDKLSTEKCPHGGQCKQFKLTLKSSLKTLNIDHTSLEHEALNCMS